MSLSKPFFSDVRVLFQGRIIQASLLFYLFVQGILLYLGDKHLHLIGDATMYFENALNILENKPYTFFDRQPFYPLILSSILFIFGKNATNVCVVFQFLFHIITSLCAFKMAELLIPQWKKSVFILVLLNPCALFHTHVLITETVYAFLFTTGYYILLEGILRKNWKAIMASGLFIGALALTRPEAQYFLYLTPILIFYLYGIFHPFKGSWKKLFFVSFITFGIAYAVTLPWQFYLFQHTTRLGITSSQKQFDHLSFTVGILENLAFEKNDLLKTYDDLLHEGEKEFEGLPQSSRMTLQEKRSFLNDYYFKKLCSYPPSIYLRAFLQSWALMYFASGSQIFMKLYTPGGSIPKDIQHKTHVFKGLSQGFLEQPFSLTLTGLLFFENVILKFLSLVGILALFLQRHFKWFFALIPPVLLVTFISLCDGQSRARLCLEPILMIWTVYGFMYLKNKWIKRRNP